jgi:hypothetical protein
MASNCLAVERKSGTSGSWKGHLEADACYKRLKQLSILNQIVEREVGPRAHLGMAVVGQVVADSKAEKSDIQQCIDLRS